MKVFIGTKSIKVVIVCIFLYSITLLNAATPWLHVDGNKIKDPAGNVVVLRGISLIDLGHLEGWRGGAINMIDRLTDKTDAQASSPGWYPKIIRIPIVPPDSTDPPYSWPYYFDPCNNDDLYNLLRTVVDYCASKDLYVIIDWHYIAKTYLHVATTSEFWEYMAPRFANDNHVMFELFNEPNNPDWPSVKTDMDTWVDIVRTHAPNNLILVGGPSYCQVLSPQATNPIDANNIVYVSHIYPAHWLSIWGSQAWYKSEIITCAAEHPVIMTEWGFTTTTDTLTNGTISNYGQPLADFREQYGVGHTAWVASEEWGPPMFEYRTSFPQGAWALRIGEGEMGGFTKDLLYDKRNDDQPSGLYGDLTGDNKVDMEDLPEFCEVWLVEDCNNNNILELDLDDDCIINFYEYSFFAQNWLK